MPQRTGVPITAAKRLKMDRLQLAKDPVPYIVAEPLPSNILEWHYVVMGPPASLYTGGYYHGKLVFPKEYPFKAPSIYMLTPNGRFKTSTRLCLSISDFHPDTWNPGWSVSTILTGLLSFMLETSATLGSIETTDKMKSIYARDSGAYNLKDKRFKELFPILVEEIEEKIRCTVPEETQAVTEAVPLSTQPNSNIVNLAVLVVFAVFAYVVKFMVQSLQ